MKWFINLSSIAIVGFHNFNFLQPAQTVLRRAGYQINKLNKYNKKKISQLTFGSLAGDRIQSASSFCMGEDN